MRPSFHWRPVALLLLLPTLALLAACRLDMRNQPRYEPFEANAFFDDGAALRPVVADTVARGQLREDEQLHTGRINGELADSFPFTPTVALVERGQERYTIFCAPCHGISGDGTGTMTRYGMEQPVSFHDPALRAESTGYYFTVITNGTRIMPSYAARIPPADRWAIVAYVRALQLSQHVDVNELTTDELPQLEQNEESSQ